MQHSYPHQFVSLKLYLNPLTHLGSQEGTTMPGLRRRKNRVKLRKRRQVEQKKLRGLVGLVLLFFLMAKVGKKNEKNGKLAVLCGYLQN